ncbi:hypothetical protein [Ruania rhizosphaerae]|uniref:hypothetical protein n=1 Tax=Ruania rhizosphaerae TaxID=1840413 RepID=UPI00135CAF31|nr:hypothetical protein [Ruania rhizosphaerae]
MGRWRRQQTETALRTFDEMGVFATWTRTRGGYTIHFGPNDALQFTMHHTGFFIMGISAVLTTMQKTHGADREAFLTQIPDTVGARNGVPIASYVPRVVRDLYSNGVISSWSATPDWKQISILYHDGTGFTGGLHELSAYVNGVLSAENYLMAFAFMFRDGSQ